MPVCKRFCQHSRCYLLTGLVALSCLICLLYPAGTDGASPVQRHTAVAISHGRWQINGQPTYAGTQAAGLLLNVRMVNATFEDRAGELAGQVGEGFDAEANTARFLKMLPEYSSHGVRAITLNLQGGYPGYEGALNSAYTPDGSLRDHYLQRVARVLDACDRQGLVVILGCFYQRQDQVLSHEDAVRAAVRHTATWIRQQGYTHIVLEIANEFPHGGFDHDILRSPAGQVSLIRLARDACPGLLVGTSGLGDGRLPSDVCEASDYLLIHFNGTPVEAIPQRVAALRKYGKPIVCNEDDKRGNDAVDALRAAVESGASWGLMLKEQNQFAPFEFLGAADDPVVYNGFRELTTP